MVLQECHRKSQPWEKLQDKPPKFQKNFKGERGGSGKSVDSKRPKRQTDQL